MTPEEIKNIMDETFPEVVNPYLLSFEAFDKESFLKFIDIVNATSELEERHLYIDSAGGSTALINPLKNIVETSNIKTVAYGKMFSSAFIFYMTLKSEKKILDDTIGMFHYPYIDNASLLPNNQIRHDSDTHKAYANHNFVDLEFYKELLNISNRVKSGDCENLEAQAAKLYFSYLFNE